MPFDLVRIRMRAPGLAASAGDIEAVDRGEGRTVVCMFRGTYGVYPKRFKQKMLDLTSDALVLRPFWCSLSRKRMTITEPVFRTDRNIRATGIGRALLACRTIARKAGRLPCQEPHARPPGRQVPGCQST